MSECFDFVVRQAPLACNVFDAGSLRFVNFFEGFFGGSNVGVKLFVVGFVREVGFDLGEPCVDVPRLGGFGHVAGKWSVGESGLPNVGVIEFGSLGGWLVCFDLFGG